MFGSILILFFLPWLDTSPVRSARFRPMYRQFFWLLVIVCVGPGLARRQAAGGHLGDPRPRLHDLLLRVLPGHPADARQARGPLPLPNSISESVLGRESVSGRTRHAQDHHRSLARRRCWPPRLLRPRRRSTNAAAAAAEVELLRPVRHVRRGALQRGFQVYHEVCANCHSLRCWRSAIWPIQAARASRPRRSRRSRPNTRSRTLDDQGNPVDAAGRPADHFRSPFPNELRPRRRTAWPRPTCR